MSGSNHDDGFQIIFPVMMYLGLALCTNMIFFLVYEKKFYGWNERTRAALAVCIGVIWPIPATAFVLYGLYYTMRFAFLRGLWQLLLGFGELAGKLFQPINRWLQRATERRQTKRVLAKARVHRG